MTLKLRPRKYAGGGVSPDGIYVTFPEYVVDTETVLGKQPLGHGMVIAVDENTGKTRGSEYGRYGTRKGAAHRVRVPDLKTENPGNPSVEELDAYAQKLYNSYRRRHSNLGNKVKVHYIKGADEKKMIQLMKSAESGDRENGFYINSDYRPFYHNCGTYGADMIKKSMPWYKFSGFGPFSWGTPEGLAPYWGRTGVYKEDK